MGQHHAIPMMVRGDESKIRTVFGDLVPIEQYSNGSGGRHAQADPFSKQPTAVSIARRLTTERSPRFDPNNIADLARFLSPGYTTTKEAP